eukprot:TRINITY_DN9272_c0_g2_i2.p1 TRINITY_DN9272_c0_g2~~TRINITY_DN9272_c0_g2_i2.p1  ORF type:complete len:611 (+),score=126.90 TRINITY_DN9272_c0_g2_i2:125-1834(+)
MASFDASRSKRQSELWGSVDIASLPESTDVSIAGSYPQSSINHVSPRKAQQEAAIAAVETENTPLLGSTSTNGSASDVRKPFQYQQPIKTSNPTRGPGHAQAYQRYRYYSKLAPANQPNSLIMPHHILPPDVFVLGGGGEQSSIVTILSMWNTMMGSSVLAMPWAIDQAGFELGLGAMVLMATLAYYTCSIVLDSGKGGRLNGQDVEFADVCLHYLGKRAYVVAVIFSVLTLVGASMAYWVLMTGFLYTVVDYVYDPHATPSTNASISTVAPTTMAIITTSHEAHHLSFGDYWTTEYVPLYLIAILFPLVNFKSLTFFTKFNSLGVVSIVYIIFFVVFTFFDGEHYKNSPAGELHTKGIVPAQLGVMSLCGVSCLAFFIHNGCLSIMRNQANPKNNKRDLFLAYFCVLMTYMLVGGLYYLSFNGKKAQIHNNFLMDFTKSSKNFVFSMIAQLFLLIQMITVYPLLQFIVRFQVMSTFFNGNPYPGFWHVFTLNVVVTILCVCMAVFYPNIGAILRYTGAVCGLVYIFALPAFVKMKMQENEGTLTWGSRILHYGLIVVGVAILVGQFIN